MVKFYAKDTIFFEESTIEFNFRVPKSSFIWKFINFEPK